jgi:hypothetical protein
MSWVLYHCVTEAQFISHASLYGKGSIPTLDCATKAQSILQDSNYARGSVWTLDLRIMSPVLYHCAAKAQ